MIKKLKKRDSEILKYIHQFHAEYKNSPPQKLIQKKFQISNFVLGYVLNKLQLYGYIEWIKIEGFRERLIIPLWKE